MFNTRILAFLAASLYIASFLPAAVEPVFKLDFQKGLNADVMIDGQWQQVEGSWSRTTEPEYSDMGIIGPALKVEHGEGRAWVGFDTPDSAHESGTFLFWVRGLENLNVPGPAFRLLSCNGSAGQGFQGQGWAAIWFSPGQGWTQIAFQGAGGSYPRFNMYKWNQVGFSWHDGRVRLYLNGDLVHEGPGSLPFERFSFGDDERSGGSLRLYDNVKIWDRLLTQAEVKHIWRHDGQIANKPLVTAPRMDNPPSIDGEIEEGEWSGAARVTGMLEAKSGEPAVDASAFYIGYDDEYIYVAMQGEMTELARTSPAAVYERFLRSEQTGRTAQVSSDDTVEFIISPDYWQAEMDTLGSWKEYKLTRGWPGTSYDYDQKIFFQKERHGNWTEYRLSANAGDGHYESIYSSDGIDGGWSPEWERASTFSSRGWQFEARIPLSSFEHAPSAGEEWGLQLSRLWQQLKQEENAWSWGMRQDNGVESDMYINREHETPRASVGVLRFAGENEPVVRVKRTGALTNKEIDWHADIYNLSGQEQKIRVQFFTDTDELNFDETIVVSAGETFEFIRHHRIEDYATGKVTFEVTTLDKTLIHRTAVPFYLHQQFGVRVAQFPHYDRFLVDLDLGAMSGVPVEEIAVDIIVRDKDGVTVADYPGLSLSAHSEQLECSSEAIPPGGYILSVIVRRGGDELGREEMDFERPGRSVWYGNHYGFEDVERDRVPYPWTDMEVKDGAVEVWGRRYLFNNSLLPEQVTTLGASVLRGPMRVLVNTSEGKEVDTSLLQAETEWQKRDRTRIEGTHTVDTDGFSIKNSFWAEYDGFVWNTLTVEPKGKSTIDYMLIEVPLNKEFSELIKAGRRIGRLNPEGYELRGDFYYVNPWFGNGDGGIQLFVDGDLHLSDRSRSIIVEVPGGEGALVRMKLIDMPTEPGAPFEIGFGFIATPVRLNLTRTPYFSPLSIQGGGAFYPSGFESLPAPDPGFDPYGYGRKTGRIYVWTSDVSIAEDASGTADFKHYGAEWMADPFQRPRDRWDTQTVRPSGTKSFIDYFVWRHWRFQNKYGYGGLYYDNPSLGTFENRELIKRLYNVTLDNHYIAGREAAMGIASNGIYNMAFGGFFSYQWAGEELNSYINANQKTYLGLIGPAEYRTEYMGYNWGWPAMFLGQARLRREWVEEYGGPEVVLDQFHGLELLHDNSPSGWHIGGVMDDVVKRARSAVERHNLRHWKYQFTPYWKQDIVELPCEDMYASFYIARPSVLAATNPLDHAGYPHGHRQRTFKHYFKNHEYFPYWLSTRNSYEIEQVRRQLEEMQDKVVMIVYNDTAWEGEMRLKPDWNKLGLGSPENLKAENAVHSTGFRVEKVSDEDGKETEKGVFFDRPEEYARVEGDEVVFPMTGFNYRMIVFEKK